MQSVELTDRYNPIIDRSLQYYGGDLKLYNQAHEKRAKAFIEYENKNFHHDTTRKAVQAEIPFAY